MHTYLKTAVAIGILVLTSCAVAPSPESKKGGAGATKSPLPQGPISGKTAFWEMYKSARTWTPDVAPLSLESKEVPGNKNADGKAAMWSATFKTHSGAGRQESSLRRVIVR